MEYVGYIHNSINDNELYGGKGSKLIEMAHLGVQIPPGFILNTKSYKKFIRDSKFHDDIFLILSKRYDKNDVLPISKKITDYILNSKIPKTVIIEVKRAYQKLRKQLGKNVSLAVRSSANIEDSEQFSFAGQAESFLNNKHLQDVITSLKKCWASLYSPQALFYILHMRNKGIIISLLDVEIAIIIQKMIFPECSGTLFTANVINNDLNQMMINSTWGLGDVITNNKINPDLIILNKINGTIVDKQIGEKERLSIPNPNGSFTSLVDMDTDLKVQCSLTDEHIKKLYLMGLKLEMYLKAPQDIEWAIENDALYILQSRAITTLKK